MQVGHDQVPSWLRESLTNLESNSIRELNLSRKGVGDKLTRHIAEALLSNTSLTHLDLSWNGLTGQAAKILAFALWKNTTLKSLDLNSNSIDSDGARILSEALLQNKSLTVLKLSWNQLLDEGAKHLATALTPPASSSSFSSHSPSLYNSTLTSLELACNNIKDDGAKYLFNAMRNNPSFVDLNLEWNEISDDCLRHGIPPVLNSNSIRSLNLFRNDHLGPDSTKIIASALQTNSSLKFLSLSGKVADAGSKYLASALTRHYQLSQLHLNKCRIGDEGAKYISTALIGNRSIVSLHLSSNKIGNDGTRAIQLMLEHNATLTELDLSVNKIGDIGVANIATALETNFTLVHLNLQQNDFSDDGRRSMEQALSSNYSLIELKGIVSDKLTALTRDRNRASGAEQIWTSMSLIDWSPGRPIQQTSTPTQSTKESTSSPHLIGSTTVTRRAAPSISAGPSIPLTSITSITFHNNLFTKLPTCFGQLSNLKTLILSRNKLVSPLSPILGSLSSLTLLDLRYNMLETLPTEIGKLKALTKLDASYNRLATLPPSLGACRSLKELHLYENKLDVIPSQIAKLSELKVFDLRHNPLKFVLESVFPSKTHLLNTKPHIDKLFVYLNSLGEGEPIKLSRVKLMLVGDANVGKTSLRKFLAAGEKVQASGLVNITTDGIEMSDIATKKNSPSFTAYDFAGQQLYYTTHQFFLTDKAIYLVVYSLSAVSNSSTQSKSIASIEYWLKSIRMRTRYAPIVLVGTHLDEVGKERAEDIFLKLKSIFKNYKIDEYFAVSTVKRSGANTSNDSLNQIKDKNFTTFCSSTSPLSSNSNNYGFMSKDKSNIVDLIPYLTHLAEQRRLVGQTVPNSCGQLINFIEEFRRNSMSPLMPFDDFKKVIVGFNTMDISGTLNLLISMGYVLYFENDLTLRDIVILNPQFLANLMCSVITLKYDYVKEGKLSHADFTEVYTSVPGERPAGPRGASAITFSLQTHISKLLTLLEKFEVLFQLSPTRLPDGTYQESSHVLVPCMLPSTMPNEFNSVVDRIKEGAPPGFIQFSRTFKFQFMPFGFFSRLIVRILNFGEDIHCWGLWRDGICFQEIPGPSASSSTPGDYGYILYDPLNYKLVFQLVCQQKFTDEQLLTPAKSKRESLHAATHIALMYPLLDKVVQAIDSLVSVFYSKEMEGMLMDRKSPVDTWVACHHCLSCKKASPVQFKLHELLNAFLNGQAQVACGYSSLNQAIVQLRDMVPDIIMSHLPILDGLEISGAIGEGGFSNVYKGTWKGKTVAVKELKFEDDTEASSQFFQSSNSIYGTNNETSVSKFKLFHHEVYMMSGFQHPNLVHLYGITTSPLRLVMEYVPNSTLNQVIHNTSQYPDISLKLKILMALDVAKAMKCLHGAMPPVVHRDLRTQNIFVHSLKEEDAVHVKVGDFGLSQHAFTGLKQYLGGWFWLAPEVLKEDASYMLESDVYSFGIMLWELLTRQVPFAEFEEYTTRREQILSESDLKDNELLQQFRDRGYVINGNKILMQEFKKQEMIDAIVCKNLRPTIPKDAPDVLAKLIASCWGSVIKERPSFDKIVQILSTYLNQQQASEPIVTASTQVEYFSPPPIYSPKSKYNDDSDDSSSDDELSTWTSHALDSLREELEEQTFDMLRSNSSSPLSSNPLSSSLSSPSSSQASTSIYTSPSQSPAPSHTTVSSSQSSTASSQLPTVSSSQSPTASSHTSNSTNNSIPVELKSFHSTSNSTAQSRSFNSPLVRSSSSLAPQKSSSSSFNNPTTTPSLQNTVKADDFSVRPRRPAPQPQRSSSKTRSNLDLLPFNMTSGVTDKPTTVEPPNSAGRRGNFANLRSISELPRVTHPAEPAASRTPKMPVIGGGRLAFRPTEPSTSQAFESTDQQSHKSTSDLSSAIPLEKQTEQIFTSQIAAIEWSRPASNVRFLARVASNNEVWMALNEGSISICDNSLNQTGSVQITKEPNIQITDILVTENVIWTCLSNGLMFAWDSERRQEIQVLNQSKVLISAIHGSIRPNDSMAVWTGDVKGNICLWSHLENTQQAKLPTPTKVTSLLHLPSISIDDGKNSSHRSSRIEGTLWAATKDQIFILDNQTLNVLHSFSAHDGEIHSMIHIDNTVWTAAHDGIKVWNQFSYQLIKSISFATNQIQGNQNNVVCMERVEIPQSLKSDESKYHIWAFTRDKMFIFNVKTREYIQKSSTHHEQPVKQVIRLAKNRIVTLATDGSINSWTYKRPTKRAPTPPQERQTQSPITRKSRPSKLAPMAPVLGTNDH